MIVDVHSSFDYFLYDIHLIYDIIIIVIIISITIIIIAKNIKISLEKF